MILSLDISSVSTGWSKFSKDGKLIDKGRILPDKKLHPLLRLHYVVKEIDKLFHNVDELVIEGIFLGYFKGKRNVTNFEYLANIHGAIFLIWIAKKYKIPYSIKANVARPRVGLKGNCHKAEVQIAVCRKYGFTSKSNLKRYQTLLEGLKSKFKGKELKKGAYKYQMEKLSKQIDQETGIGEDIADSIVVGLAYLKGAKK